MPGRLPGDLAELYGAVGGGELADGNLALLPPAVADDAQDLSLATAGELLRSWDWPVPDPLVVFADNGAGDAFGVWVPRDGAASPLVVRIGEVFEERCLAVVGDDLPSFLAGWTAYYHAWHAAHGGGHSDALDVLGVPQDLRSMDDGGTDDELAALLHWASPGLPDPRPDPYARGMTAEEVDAHARR